MRVPVSFYERSVAFSSETREKIGKLLAKDAAKFIERAQIAAGEYQDTAQAWDTGPTPKTIRLSIEEVGRLAKSTAAALTALSDAAVRFIREAKALEGERSLDRISSEAIEALCEDLQLLTSACERAAKFNELNRGQGNTGDDARRHFIADCARIYREVTGTTPKPSRSGTFAKVMRLVLEAAGEKAAGISHDLLVSILKPVR